MTGPGVARVPSRIRRLRIGRPRIGRPHPMPATIPPDPAASLAGPLDPVLLQLRSALLPHRRRLWLRRLVRRTWIALAVVALAELGLWTLARFMPIATAPILAATIPLAGLLGWLVVGIRARPTLGEAALALDVEGSLGDRASSALELAVEFPGSAGPEAAPADEAPEVQLDEAAEADRFVRRQRRDALAAVRAAPSSLFAPRLSRQPAAAALVAVLLLVPVVVIANPQDAVIARAAADRGGGRSPGRAPRPGRPGPRGQGAGRQRPADAGSRRSCATWPSGCATTRTSWTSTWPASARSRTRFAPRPIRPTSSARRR